MNPATAGSQYVPAAGLSFRKQWLGIDQSPSSLLASASLRLGNYDIYNPRMLINRSNFRSREKVGLGFGLYTDQNGAASTRGLNMAYAYHIKLQRSSLSFGLSGNVEQSRLDGTSWDPLAPNDPLLPALKESYFGYNANIGVCYYGPVFLFGFAANQVLPLQNNFSKEERVKQDFILHGAYMFRSRESLKLEPALNIRYLDYKAVEFDIQTKIYIQHSHWISLTYRSYGALNLGAGIWVKGYYLAYDWEVNLSSMARYSAGTHSIHLGINLGMRSY